MAKDKKTATEVAIEEREAEYRARVQMVADQITLVLSFTAQLIPDIDILKKASEGSSDRVSTVQAMAPIIMAHGGDWEQKEFQAKKVAKRAKAILNLVEVLIETAKEETEFREKAEAKSKGRDQLMKALGLE